MSSDARDKSRDLKKTAIERSLIDVDQTMNEATEALALEKNDEAVRLYKQLLSSLEDRYPGNMEKIPADVLIRRYKILNGLSKAFSSGGHLNQAIQNALEASALTQGPLSDFTELHIQSSVDLAGYYIKSGDVQSARALITKATSVEKGDDPQLWQALISLGTGKLFNALGKLDVAPRVIQSGIDALATPEEPEKILLKADLYLALGDVYMKLEHRDEALQSWKEAIVLLNDRGKKAFLKYEYFSALSYFAKARPIFQFLGREPDVIQIRADSEILLAKIMDIRGRWDDAYKLFSGVVELFHGTGFEDSRLFILAHAGVGNYFIQQKQYDRAEAELKKSTAAAKQFRDRLGFCQANYYLGVAFSKRGSDEQGIELFKRSLEHLKKIESSYEVLQTIALINNQLGFIEMKNRRREEAKEYFNLSVETMKDAPFDLSLGEAYRFLGELHSENRQYTQAERYLKKALEIFEKNGAMFELSRLYRSLGSNLLNMGDIDKAVFFFDECIGLQEKLGVESELPMAYSNRAKISVMKEEYAEAEAYFTKDFNIAKKSDNKHSLAFSYYQLGRIRRILTRTHSAEDFLRRSLDLFTSVNNKTMIGGVLLELALCASARKDIKGATDYCARAQTMYEHNRNSLEMARLLLTRGIVLRDAKRKQMAQRCFEDCLRLHEKLNITTIDLAEAYYEFALFWQDQGDRKEASQQLSLAIETTEKLGLGKKMSNYAVLLNDIDPEAAAKAQLSRFMGKATVEQISKRKRSRPPATACWTATTACFW